MTAWRLDEKRGQTESKMDRGREDNRVKTKGWNYKGAHRAVDGYHCVHTLIIAAQDKDQQNVEKPNAGRGCGKVDNNDDDVDAVVGCTDLSP